MLGLGALAGHAAALVLDTTVHVSVAGLFIPGLISYRPAWTSLGILAAELMVLVYASFSMRKRIGTKDCGGCTGLPTASSASRQCMALRPCTDSAQPWVFGLYVAAVASVAGATAWRILVPPARARPRRPASTDKLARPTGASRSTVRSGATSAAVSGVSRVS